MRNARRINCNDCLQSLYEQHDFDFDVANKVLHGDFEKVKRTVPTSFHADFEESYNLRFTRYGKREKSKVATTAQRSSFSRSATQSSFSRTEKAKPVVSSPAYTTPKEVKPETVLVPLKKGELIKHKSFGEGVVKSSDGKYVKIEFKNVGEKTFVNPDAFEKGFLTKM